MYALRVSGLARLVARVAPPPRAQTAKGEGRKGPAASAAASGFDPFVVLREGGESGLRAALAGLDLAALRQLVRTHRLDPHRVSAPRGAARPGVAAFRAKGVALGQPRTGVPPCQ